jgi:hypothetical protein
MSTLLESINDALVEDPIIDEVGYILNLLESRLSNDMISYYESYSIIEGLIEQGISSDLINDIIEEGKYDLVRRSTNVIYS